MKSTVVATKHPLAQRTVVVTRPEGQNETLCQLLQQAGADPVKFPVIRIENPQDRAYLDNIKRLARYHMAIFISANAVKYGLAHVDLIPPNVQIAAVGKATARALQDQGVHVDIFPEGQYNSEALLQLPQLQHQSIDTKTIAIFRGVGGREHLAQTLEQRGAQVTYIECYQRLKPRISTKQLTALWQKKQLDIIVVTSNEGLQNLFEMVGESARPYLLNTPLLLASERAKELARKLGFTAALPMAEKVSDQAILKALIHWFHKGHKVAYE